MPLFVVRIPTTKVKILEWACRDNNYINVVKISNKKLINGWKILKRLGYIFLLFFLGVWLKETAFKSKAKLHELLEEKLTIVG